MAKRLSRMNCIREIDKRGGEINIEGKYQTEPLAVQDKQKVRGRTLVLMRCTGWRQYSRAFGARWAYLAYLCGNDDSGLWAVRVAGTCETVGEALDWITPIQVRKARDARKRVLRQGDVYAVESCADAPSSIGRHEWFRNARLLLHSDPDQPHAPLHVPFACRMYQQRAYEMGRSSTRGDAD